MPDFQPHASWILLAVLLNDAQAGGSLRDLLAAADYANHAIPMYSELCGGLQELTAAGLVECSTPARFRAALPTRQAYQRIEESTRSLSKRWDALEAWLNTQDNPAVDVAWRISQQDYQQAVDEYLKTA